MTVSVSKQVTDFAEQAEAWTRAQAAANPDEDLWRAVGTVTTVVANTRNSLCWPSGVPHPCIGRFEYPSGSETAAFLSSA